MGWLRKRFGEASTRSGLGVAFMVASTFAPPQYQLLVQGIAGALGLGGAVKADPGNH
jgi:hypothetical protein